MHILIKFYILKKKKSINQSLIYCTNCINQTFQGIYHHHISISSTTPFFERHCLSFRHLPFISFSFTSPVFVNDEKRRGHLRFRAFPLATILNAPLARKAEQKFASSAQTKFLATERERALHFVPRLCSRSGIICCASKRAPVKIRRNQIVHVCMCAQRRVSGWMGQQRGREEFERGGENSACAG